MSETKSAPVDVRYLFRYRDMVAKTLDAHKKIIQQHGACWWGWWKRPAEPARMEVWTALAQQVLDRPVWVGLFDSGHDKAYLAKIETVIRPRVDASGRCESLPPPKGEEELVPEYYRASPFSRAWLRIIEISGEIAIFGKGAYAYAKAPPLPDFKAADLEKHLIDKVISDGSELRSMDTTIWEIARAGDDAREGRVFTFNLQSHAPLKREPIPLKYGSILHITDPHFSLGGHRGQHGWGLDSESGTKTTLADAIHQALNKDHISIGAIIVTGDLTFVGSDEEFDAAFKSLYNLMGKLDIGREHLVVIPGNHDIRWTTDAVYSEKSPVVVAPDEAQAGYTKFFDRMFHHEPDQGLCMARRYVLPNGAVVEIAALNSSTLETGKNFLAGMGRIDEHTFSRTAAELGWVPREPSRALRVLALHHHLTPTEDIEPADGYLKGFGMAIDGPRVQRLAAEHGVQLVLHGHKHRAFLWRSSVFELPEEKKTGYRGDLSIVGGGSAGSTERPNNKNYFSVLTVKPNRLELAIYQAATQTNLGAPGMFGRMATWHAEIRVQPSGHMTLGPWEDNAEAK